jgi:hypothetical protein
LINEINEQVQIKKQIATTKKETAGYEVERIQKEIVISQADLDTERARKNLASVQNEREAARLEAERDLINASMTGIQDLMNAEAESAQEINNSERTTVALENASRVKMLQEALARTLDSHRTIKDDEEKTIKFIANEEADATFKKAQINAAPQITANLQHLLSM